VPWLEQSFGFAERVRIGEDHRSQMSVGDGAIILADTGGNRRPPDPEAISQSIIVRVASARAQWDRARGHGVQIVTDPTDFPFGERQWTARDPWGHHWTFSETIRDTAPEEWGGETVGPG
jgi:uncharacterized glyoxalase superfamily protein PhnB